MKLVSRCLMLASAPVLALAIVNAAEPAVKPNILYIMADDHTSQAWGCYGSRLAPFAKTPNIDHLAREGVQRR